MRAGKSYGEIGKNEKEISCCEETFFVEEKFTAKSVGSGEVEVLATPPMIAFMEHVTMNCMRRFIPESARHTKSHAQRSAHSVNSHKFSIAENARAKSSIKSSKFQCSEIKKIFFSDQEPL